MKKLCCLILCLLIAPWASATRLVMISHAPNSDKWWSVIKQSIQDASQDLGIQIEYWNPPDGDLKKMAALLEKARQEHVDGVMTTIADFNTLAPAIQALGKDHIPVVTFNSGLNSQSNVLGALMHIGQPEYQAAYEAGERARKEGAKRVVCLNNFANNSVSNDRCRGFAEGTGNGAENAMLVIDGNENDSRTKIFNYLSAHPEIDSVMALGPMSAHPLLDVMKKLPNRQLKVYTFDLSDRIVQAIKTGDIRFAIDQQPYLQGYISAMVLNYWLTMPHPDNNVLADIDKINKKVKNNPKLLERLKEYGLSPVYKARNIQSGPGFVTKENASKVEKYAGKYR